MKNETGSGHVIFLLVAATMAAFVMTGRANAATGQVLSEREKLARCYSQITGTRLSPNDALWQSLATKSGTKICLDLLNSVQFGSDGVLTQPANPVHVRILKQFNDFHRSWLERQAFNQYELQDYLFRTMDVYDAQEAALFVTRSFFASGVPYSSVLHGQTGLQAVRDVNGATGGTTRFQRVTRTAGFGDTWLDDSIVYDMTSKWPGYTPPNQPLNNIAYDVMDPAQTMLARITVPLVQVGTLVGVKPQTGSAMFPTFYTQLSGSDGVINPRGLAVPYNAITSHGGGAIGTQAFMLLNFGHGVEYSTNGTTKLPRRWMDTVMKTFMCRSGPYVRNQDILSYVVAGADGVPPFRQAQSCLRCHAALDQAAMTTRNLTIAVSGGTEVHGMSKTLVSMAKFNVIAGAEAGQASWPSKPVASFNLQTPSGKLYLRSINGALIDRDVNGLDGLGQALSDTDDFYACAAKRYVQYFTGVDVKLYDPLDDSNQAVAAGESDHDKELKTFVLDLGKELKATGSLKTLVKRIVESDYYRQADFGR